MCNPRKLKPGKLYFAAIDFSIPKLEFKEKDNLASSYTRITYHYSKGTAFLYVGPLYKIFNSNTHEFLVGDKTIVLINSCIREVLVTAELWKNLTQAFAE
jgi:hypothetical protein